MEFSFALFFEMEISHIAQDDLEFIIPLFHSPKSWITRVYHPDLKIL